ncbi:MAG: 1-deoxy-D-xylulose-5-phosphate reductoisomerase, partial [Actinomycetota bacterium]
QAAEFGVSLLGICGEAGGGAPESATVIRGPDSAERVAAECDAQVVLNAVVGAAGLKSSLAALSARKTLALANKESLVAAGEVVMAKAEPGQLRPVDSEHSALWQLLEGLEPDEVRKIFITGSGGPFRGFTGKDFEQVTVAAALKHPVWQMGDKITIDSATLMNKGLEVIEAHFLFGFTYDEIDVVIHPQGMVHAMAETRDGGVIAHAALPDMRLPIQLALAWPHRLPAPDGKRMDWSNMGPMTFEAPDLESFPCLALAFEAGKQGGTYPAVMNAANEVAVQGFLEERVSFSGIASVIEKVLASHQAGEPDLEGILEADQWARRIAGELTGLPPSPDPAGPGEADQ